LLALFNEASHCLDSLRRERRYRAEFAGRIAAMLYVGIVQLLNETRDAISSVRSPQVSYSADKRGRAKQGR
jgi:hypothetical protein